MIHTKNIKKTGLVLAICIFLQNAPIHAISLNPLHLFKSLFSTKQSNVKKTSFKKFAIFSSIFATICAGAYFLYKKSSNNKPAPAQKLRKGQQNPRKKVRKKKLSRSTQKPNEPTKPDNKKTPAVQLPETAWDYVQQKLREKGLPRSREYKRSPLVEACRYLGPEEVKCLLTHYEEIPDNFIFFNMCINDNKNPEILKTLRLLLKYDKYNLMKLNYAYSEHIAFWAYEKANKQALDILKFLIGKGHLDVDAEDPMESSPFPRPVRGTLLQRACKDGNKEIIKLLLQMGARLAYGSRRDDTPLHLAYNHRDKEIIKLLLDHNANIETRDSIGDTLLHKACKDGNKEIIELLLNKDANINAKDYSRNTPLHLACKDGNKEIVELLLDRGANINARDYNRNTPLHLACLKDEKEVAELLLDRGANIEILIKPLHYAYFTGNFQIIDLLLKKGANTKMLAEKKDQIQHEIENRNLKNNRNPKNKGERLAKLEKIVATHKGVQIIIKKLQERANFSEARSELKKVVKNQSIPAYDRQNALIALCKETTSAHEKEVIRNLLQHIPFNFRFFNDEACAELRQLAFAPDITDVNEKYFLDQAYIFCQDSNQMKDIILQEYSAYTNKNGILDNLLSDATARHPHKNRDAIIKTCQLLINHPGKKIPQDIFATHILGFTDIEGITMPSRTQVEIEEEGEE